MRHSFFISIATRVVSYRRKYCLVLLAITAALTGCDNKEPPAPAATAPAASATTEQQAAPADAEVAAVPLEATSMTWTPEELENLLAPIALYPDQILAQVLMASTNPQEVLDAGNWLLQNTSLQGDDLNAAGEKMGFTPPVLALIQFPQVVDMLCQDMEWTAELGQAYVNDQAGVLDAAQRLRVQAKEVGNLQNSEQLKVETVTQGDQQVVTINPPNPQVVYVPQYDPVAVYAQPPAAPVAAAAPAATSTSDDKDEGYSTGAMVTTGLLSFGAGILVSEIFDDDDDDYYGGGGYWGAPPPYYPPYPYRPPYGNGFYPSNGYNRPGGNFNNNNIIINQDNNYWKNRQTGNDRSPISEARKDRPELQNLNSAAAKGPKRGAPAKGEGYAGARTGNMGKGTPGKVAAAKPGNLNAQQKLPKVQGSYAGAKPGGAKASQAAAARSLPKPAGTYAGAKPTAQPGGPGMADRGRTATTTTRAAPSRPVVKSPIQTRQAAPTRQAPAANPNGGTRPSAISGSNRGSQDRMASQRGRQSMPQGGATRARAKSGGGGGGRSGSGGGGRRR